MGRDADAVGAELESLLGDAGRRQRMAASALELVEEGRGAVERTLAVVAPDLAGAPQDQRGGA